MTLMEERSGSARSAWGNRTGRAVFVSLGMFLLGAWQVLAGCGISWQAPVNHFNGVNEQGFVSYWEELGRLDFGRQGGGENLELPVIINFRSNRESSSPYLGYGWMLALLESSIYQVDERRFIMTQPDGYQRWFWRGQPADTVLKGQGNWMAEIKGDIIVAQASCGWRFDYAKGRLISMGTPDDRTIEFIYDGAVCTGIREKGVTKLEVERDASGKTVAITGNGQRMEIGLGDKPRVQAIGGQRVVGRIDQSLKSMTFADSVRPVYTFGVSEDLKPTLRIQTPAKPERLIAWDPATHRIDSDNGWTYTVKHDGDMAKNAEIRRTDPKGRSEYWHDDAARGQEIVQTLDGVRTIRKEFASGKLRGRLREVVKTAPGAEPQTVEKYRYDENGRMLFAKKNDETHEYRWSDDGSEKTVYKNDRPFSVSKYDALGRVVQYDQPGYGRQTFEYPGTDVRKVVTIPEVFQKDGIGDKALDFANQTVRLERGGKTVEEWLPGGSHFEYSYDQITGHVIAASRDGKLLYEYLRDGETMTRVNHLVKEIKEQLQ